MDTLTLSDHVVALSEADDHLSFATSLIDRGEFDDQSRFELLRQCSGIRHRLQDPCLYLAVVGEFSSGKSSFINAFLRQDLLPTSALVATAAPTWIRQGDQLAVTLHPVADPAVSTPLGRRKGDPTTDPRALLNEARANSELGDRLTKIDVSLPSSELEDGLVVIDTPGFNATDAGHCELSQAVLRTEADLAVVVLPADAAVSQALATYLQSTLNEAALKRLLFVVTKLANIDDEEHDRLLEVIRRRLRTMLDIEEPWVAACSLRGVLRAINGADPDDEDRRWITVFDGVRGQLRAELVRTRVAAVADKTLSLVDETMLQLEVNLEERLAALAAGRSALDGARIKDLDQFLAEHDAAAVSSIAAVGRDRRQLVKRRVDAAASRVRKTMSSDLAKQHNVKQIQSYVENDFTAIAQAQFERSSIAVHELHEELVEATHGISQKVDAAFEQQYRVLQLLDTGSERKRVSSDLPTGLQETVSVAVGPGSSAAVAVKTESNLETGGAIGGAAIGTAIFPVVGTAIGWFVGGFIGSLFGPSVETVRSQTESELDGAIREAASRVEASLSSRYDRFLGECESLLKIRIRDYRDGYEEMIDRMIREHGEEVREIELKKSQLEADMTEISRRRRRIEKNRRAIDIRSTPVSDVS